MAEAADWGLSMCINRRVGACEDWCPWPWCRDLGWMYPVSSNMLRSIPVYQNSYTVRIHDVVQSHWRAPGAFSGGTWRFWQVTLLCFSAVLQSSSLLNEIEKTWVSVWWRNMPEQQHLSAWCLKKAVVVVAVGSVLTSILLLNFWLRSYRTLSYLHHIAQLPSDAGEFAKLSFKNNVLSKIDLNEYIG